MFKSEIVWKTLVTTLRHSLSQVFSQKNLRISHQASPRTQQPLGSPNPGQSAPVPMGHPLLQLAACERLPFLPWGGDFTRFNGIFWCFCLFWFAKKVLLKTSLNQICPNISCLFTKWSLTKESIDERTACKKNGRIRTSLLALETSQNYLNSVLLGKQKESAPTCYSLDIKLHRDATQLDDYQWHKENKEKNCSFWWLMAARGGNFWERLLSSLSKKI